MPLILAIEPDWRQSSKLAMIARNQLRAELIVTDSVEEALATLDERVPDLLLTSPLLPSKDGAALSKRLRELDEDGLRVQTVIIPTLATPGTRLRPKGGRPDVRGRSLSNPAAGGCDLVVFGMQIAAQLERVAAERPRTPRPVPPRADKPIAAAVPAFEEEVPIASSVDPPIDPSLDEADDAEVEPAVVLDVAERKAEAVAADTLDLNDPDWTDVLDAMRRDIEQARASDHPLLFEPVLPDLTTAIPDMSPTGSPAEVVEAPDAIPRESPPPAPAAEAGQVETIPRKRRRRRSPPQDEWGFYDPSRCGVSALIAKVNEITKQADGTRKKSS